MKSKLSRLLIAIAPLVALTSGPVHALDQIIREYQPIRSSGMGGVRITTGLYDENFFNNPARVTANPRSKFVLAEIMAELSNPQNISSVSSGVSGGGDVIQSLGNTAGSNTHVRPQLALLNYYLAPTEDRKWGLGFGLFSSTQADLDLRIADQIAAQAITDLGFAVTFGRKFLENDRLSVGVTGHLAYRLASNPSFSLANLLTGQSISPLTNGGQGSMFDFDIGATYRLPLWETSPFKFSVGASLDNLLGGGFSNLSITVVPNLTCPGGGQCLPPAQPRSLGFGVSMAREEWGPFTNTIFALEFTDIGNNSNTAQGSNPYVYGGGSPYRLIHMGGETHWKIFALRAGINQGYLAAGVGIDLRFFTIDAATYGEEMSLNAGGFEDRRYALQIGFQI